MNFSKISKIFYLVVLSALSNGSLSCAQSSISLAPLSASPASQIASLLQGPGAQISNVTISGNTQSIASFTSTDLTLDINGGLLLTTGNAQSAGSLHGANSFASATAKGRMGKKVLDVNLLAMIRANSQLPPNLPLYDAYILEFDVVPSSTKLELKYKFASDEFPLYNCTDFTDVMAIHVTDMAQNPVAVTNFVQTTSSSKAVAINNINSGAVVLGQAYKCGAPYSGLPGNMSIYQDNTASQNISYNGITQLLTAIATVTPCSTYHVKIVLADVGDDDRDSGCFLVEKGVSSADATITSIVACNQLMGITGYYLLEGCNTTNTAIVTISTSPSALTATYNLTMAGSSSNPLTTVDIAISNPLTLGPGSTGTFTITAVDDSPNQENPEVGVFSLVSNLCPTAPPIATFELKVFDKPHIHRTVTGIGICYGTSAKYDYELIFLGLSNSNFNPFSFNVIPSSTASVTALNNIGAQFSFWPSTTTTYTVSSVGLGGCTTLPTIPIQIDLPGGSSPLTCLASSFGLVSCTSPNSGQINVTASGGTAPYTYTCMSAQSTFTNTSGLVSGLSVGTYTIILTDASSCSASSVVTLAYNMPQINSCTTQNICLGQSYPLQASVANLSNTGIITWLNSSSASSSPQGTIVNLTQNAIYTIQVVDGACATSCTKSLNVTEFANFTASVINCLSAPSISLTTTNPIAVNYSGPNTGTTNSGPFSGLSLTGLSSGSYTLSATSSDGCTMTKLLNLYPSFSSSTATLVHPPCMGSNAGQFSAVLSGGKTPYTIALLPASSGAISVAGAIAKVTNLSAGNYTATLADASGCSFSTIFTLTQPIVSLNVTTLANATCPNRPPIGRDGKIECSFIKNGVASLVNWQYGANSSSMSAVSASVSSTFTISNLGIGEFIVTALDAACTYSTVVTLNSNIYCKLNSLQITPSFCGSSTYDIVMNGWTSTAPNSILKDAAGSTVITLGVPNSSCPASALTIPLNDCPRKLYSHKLRIVSSCQTNSSSNGSYMSWLNQINLSPVGATYTLTPTFPNTSNIYDGNQCFTDIISVPQADAMPTYSYWPLGAPSTSSGSSLPELTMHNPMVNYQPVPNPLTYSFAPSLTTATISPINNGVNFTGATKVSGSFTSGTTYTVTASTSTPITSCTYKFIAPTALPLAISSATISVGSSTVTCKHQVTSARIQLPLAYFNDLDYDCYLEVAGTSGTWQKASQEINSSYALNTFNSWKEGFIRPIAPDIASHEFLYVTPGTYRVAFVTKCTPWQGWLGPPVPSPCNTLSPLLYNCYTTNNTFTILPPTSCP
jgi:SprB repeat